MPADSELYVEALLDNSDGKLLYEESEVLIRKGISKEGRITIKINDRQVQSEEYYKLMEIAGIRRANPPNFLLQGKVKRVAQADERSLYSLLTEIVGTKAYEEQKGESLEIIDSVVIDEKKANDLLEEFREKLGELEVDKEDFKQYEENFKAGNQYGF